MFPATRATLRDRLEHLLGHAPRETSLTSDITASATTVTLDSVSDVNVDTLLEIGAEIMLVTAVTGSDATVIRGYQSSEATTHSSGDRVRANVRYTRQNLNEALDTSVNNWLSTYMPRLVWDETTAGKWLPQRYVYTVPSEAQAVRDVAWKTPGYEEIRYVGFSGLDNYPSSIASTGKGVRVFEHGLYGQSVLVYYETAWPRLETDSDTVPDDFPPEADDLIVTGAALYLLGWRLTPKYRLDETVFAREQRSSVPANANMRMMAMMRQEWVQGVERVRNQRSGGTPSPRKMWVGR